MERRRISIQVQGVIDVIVEKRLFNENRCKIINYVMENPGRHFSSIMRELDFTKRGLGYHLEILVKEELIETKSLGIFKFYYPAGYDETKKNLTPKQQEIVDIVRKGSSTKKEIANIMGQTPASVYYHLKNLLKMGIVERKEIGYHKYQWHAVEGR